LDVSVTSVPVMCVSVSLVSSSMAAARTLSGFSQSVNLRHTAQLKDSHNR
jgi:hypothetical protein